MREKGCDPQHAVDNLLARSRNPSLRTYHERHDARPLPPTAIRSGSPGIDSRASPLLRMLGPIPVILERSRFCTHREKLVVLHGVRRGCGRLGHCRFACRRPGRTRGYLLTSVRNGRRRRSRRRDAVSGFCTATRTKGAPLSERIENASARCVPLVTRSQESSYVACIACWREGSSVLEVPGAPCRSHFQNANVRPDKAGEHAADHRLCNLLNENDSRTDLVRRLKRMHGKQT